MMMLTSKAPISRDREREWNVSVRVGHTRVEGERENEKRRVTYPIPAKERCDKVETCE